MNSQKRKTEVLQSLADFVNNLLIDFNQLATSLKASSKTITQMNHNLKNKLLLANEIDSKVVVKDILNHLLRVSQIKGVQNIVLSILSKVIAFVKILEKHQTKQSLLQRNQEMGQILSSIIDIIILLKNQNKNIDITLRIIQATFSLIDEKMLQFANYSNLVRIYSVCFECCQSNATIQNISVSALFSLTQIIFSNRNNRDWLLILMEMLQYLFQGKKFLWIKDKQLNGMIWDLINVAIKAFPTDKMPQLFENRLIINLLIKMYNLSAQKAFVESEDVQKSITLNKSFIKEQNDRNINLKKGYFPDFIRFYKTFIYFTIYLYFKSSPQYRELIPFRNNFHLFKSLYQTARNSKLYLLLEGASILLSQNSYFLIEQEQGIILIDVFNKVCEQLDRSQRPLEFCIDKRDLYLDRLCGDFNKINDNEFVKIIKNTILCLRRNLQNQSHTFQQKIIMQQKSISNQIDQLDKKPSISMKKRWERLIKIVLKIIKHLTSLNLKEGSNQQIVRKLIGELQYWFIISPTRKLKNLILQQIFLTSTFLDSRIQSIKASQCLQIGSNIIYGYYDTLDTFGLAIIIRMITGVQISWQEGKGFDQLEEVCIMTEKLFTEQQLVHSPQSFIKTVHAFAQCLTGLLADFEQPLKQSKNHHKKHVERYHRMIIYILTKIQNILYQNGQYIQSQWNFLTGLWISSASNKNSEIRHKLLNHLLSVITFVIKKKHINQQTIIILYQQLAKLSLIDISKTIIIHLKHILLNISSENAILQLFKTLSVILQTRGSQTIHQQLFQFVEMIIKQSLFQVKSVQKLIRIIDNVNFISKDKGEQYKVVNLIWNISDHLKTLKQNHEDTQNKEAWMHLFKKIIYLAEITENGETKQSCIHAFTQIIAESIIIMGQELFLSILSKEYVKIFSILMSFEKVKNEKSLEQQPHIDQAETVQNHKQNLQPQIKTLNIDMIRIGVKNFIKITRKCLSISIQVSKGMFLEAFAHIHRQLNQKKTNNIEYLIQLNVFVQYFQEILHLQQYQSLNLNEDVIKILQNIQKNHGSLDKSTFTWKKYYTTFEEIKFSFLPQ